MRDISLRMELVLVIDSALDLPRTERFKDCGNTMKEWVGVLIELDALIQDLYSARLHCIEERLPGSMGCLGTHQDSDLFETLPFAIQSQKRTNLEEAGCDVEGLGYTRPLFQVAEPGPAGDAVVDDEEVAAFVFDAHEYSLREFTRA